MRCSLQKVNSSIKTRHRQYFVDEHLEQFLVALYGTVSFGYLVVYKTKTFKFLTSNLADKEWRECFLVHGHLAPGT